MTFKDALSQNAQRVFLNTDEFAEQVIYTPSGGFAKTIKAVIVRKDLSPADENTGRSLKNQAEVFISTDSVTGVSSINRRDDRITLADVEGILREARINDVLGRDDGMWHLVVGW